ncbi:LysR substrate-binding domain-containing protein [Sphingomonas sp. MG17]|uniref:LysR substrate-binding domain-containing protein n=1 Tax=Sphingomonas tagetis TaxID=2949092 RepID=A0A9X2KKM4_9SPHN|nr:LysR substrate-binding domain-containing protein [Sphingomonas tagetis]MCP3729880.1 LysR substrate-binding domain-containing protein [Sphingomonas tagetis]
MHQRLTLPQLEAFLTLEATANFSAAAAALGVSQPAFSRTIHQIEVRLGVRLFDRDSRHVRLTPAGQQLRPIAERLLKDYDRLFREFESHVEGREGRVRVATLPSIAATLLPGAIRRFCETHPGVKVDIWEDVGPPVHRMVAEGEADIGIAPRPAASMALDFKPIYQDRLVLVCRADDELARAAHGWSVFGERPFIAMSTDTDLRGMIDRALAAANVVVEPLFNCKYPTTAGALVIESQGISILTRLGVEQIRSPDLAWRELDGPDAFRLIGLVTSPGRSLMSPAHDFMREVEKEARALGRAA